MRIEFLVFAAAFRCRISRLERAGHIGRKAVEFDQPEDNNSPMMKNEKRNHLASWGFLIACILAPLVRAEGAQSRVDQFQGADAGAKIAACIAALPASGGTCDATMLTGPQNIGQLRIAHSKVQVLLGTGTYKVAEGIDIEADGVVIQGISGTIIQKTGKGFAILLSGAGHVISRTTLDHLHLVGDPSTFNGGIGVAIHPGCGADFVTIENVVVDSFGQYGIIVSGKVNDLTVRNVRAVNHGSPDAAWPMIGIAIDPKTHSERLVMDNVFSEIGHSNGKASAAIKVQNFRTATVTNLTAVGGTEETVSVAGIGDLTASNWTIRGGAPGNQGFGLMLSTESNNGDPTVLATGPRQWNFDHISFEGTFHPNFAIVFGRPGNKNVKLSYISARGLECVMTQNGWAQDIKVENSEFGQFNMSRYPGTLFHNSVLNNVTIDSGPLILPGNRNLVSSAIVRGGTIALIGSNNVLRFSTSSGSNGNGITLGGDMNVVYHCNVTGQRASAIAVNRGSGNLVHGSTFSGGVIDQGAKTMLPGRDGGLVHAGSGPPSGSCASGAVYVRTDGAPDSTLYVCDSGSWSAK